MPYPDTFVKRYYFSLTFILMSATLHLSPHQNFLLLPMMGGRGVETDLANNGGRFKQKEKK